MHHSTHAKAKKFFKKVYNTRGLFYHNWNHIQLMLNLANIFDVLQNNHNLYYAILAHDAVYEPGSMHNEAKSAEFFKNWANQTNFDGDVDKITNMIKATRGHACNMAHCDEQTLMLLDLDLSGLAGNFAFAHNNCMLMSKDWLTNHTDLNSFYRRLEFFLGALLTKPQMFYVFTRFEQSAKQNAQKLLSMLKNRKYANDISV